MYKDKIKRIIYDISRTIYRVYYIEENVQDT